MKRSLFLISSVSILALSISCSNTNRNLSSKQVEDSENTSSNQTNVDTTKSETQTNMSDSIIGQIGTSKDSTINNGNSNVISHGAPDQAKLDSIKKAKQKERNQ